MIFALIPLFCLAIAALVNAWVGTLAERRQTRYAGWRRTRAWVGILAVTSQLGLLISTVYVTTGIQTREQQLGTTTWMVRASMALFIVMLPCAITRSGWTRWGLPLASLVFLGIAALVAALSQFTF